MTRKMKDSGIEYLGNIPADWKCVDFRRCVSLKQGLQIAQSNRFYEDGPKRYIYITLRYINSNNKQEKEYIENPDKGVICTKDDVLFVRTGSTGLIVTGVDGVFHNNFFKIIYQKEYITKDYLIYYLIQQNIIDYFNLLAGTTTIPDLNHGDFLSTKVLLPSLNEQKLITYYLDNKCSKIDETVQKEKQVIEKLKQYKQSVITEAVTKGLDSDVKMKDSGVEWIGEIPEHWDIICLKYLAASEKNSIVDGPFGSDMKNEEYVDEGVPIIQLNNIGEGVHKLNNLKYITEEKANGLKRHTIYPREIVIAKMMPAGRAAIVSSRFNKYIVSSDSIRLKLNSNSLNNFIVYCLNIYAKNEAEIQSTGTTRSRINLSIVKNLHLAVPCLTEQKQIADYLDKKCASIDKAILNKEKLIEKLTEYKKSLIYECVTGKREV